MKKKERAIFIQKTLDHLFPDPKIPLTHTSSYELLIAVLLSAQCTDERVNLVTPKLFAKANTPKEMALLDEETIYSIIQPCGLGKNKAKAIKQLSKQILENFNGVVPSTLEQLESLQGVGHKTASVMMIQAFNIPAFPVDTHIHRLGTRWKLTSGKNVEQTEKDLKSLFPKDSWAKLHLQIIYFGRAFCPARGHQIENCPICSIIETQ
jgi:endonuclease-3